MNEVVIAWFGLLFGMSGCGAVYALVGRWLRSSTGGLR